MEQSSGINRFDRRRMHFEQQAWRLAGENKSVPSRPPARVKSDREDVGAEGEGKVYKTRKIYLTRNTILRILIRKRRRRIVVAVVLL